MKSFLSFSRSKHSSNRSGYSTATLTFNENPERMTQHLKQGEGTVAEYIPRFAIHSQHKKFDDASLAGHFYEGLHGDIKDELAVREWKALKDLQVLAGRWMPGLAKGNKRRNRRRGSPNPRATPGRTPFLAGMTVRSLRPSLPCRPQPERPPRGYFYAVDFASNGLPGPGSSYSMYRLEREVAS